MQESMLTRFKKSDFMEKISLVIALIVMVVLFSIFNKNYATSQNLTNILVACSLMGFVAIAETYLIIANQIDLSAGSVAAFSSVLSAILVKVGITPILALLLAVLAGCFIGALNAATINHLKLQPFIATLASMSIVRGFDYILCSGKAVGIAKAKYNKIGSYRIFGFLPITVLLLIVFFVVLGRHPRQDVFRPQHLCARRKRVRRKTRGLKPDQDHLQALYPFRRAGGAGWRIACGAHELRAAFLRGRVGIRRGHGGGSRRRGVYGGTGTILGTLLGMLILQGFNTGLLMLGVQTFWQQVAKGALLVIALTFDYLRKRSRIKKELEESKALR